jgi:transcriptional regulator with XRE-family HTH domain
MTMDNFSDWLNKQMQERDWTQSDMARASGLTRQAIGRYLGEKTKTPDEFALIKIARALKIPPETVYRAAGILPPDPAKDEWVEEMNYKIKLIPSALRGVATSFIDSLVEGSETPKRKPNQKHKTTTP